MTKRELREIMQSALKSEYGFAPTLGSITLLESSDDGTYILASINGNVYSFNGDYRIGKINGIYVGKGTIEKK